MTGTDSDTAAALADAAAAAAGVRIRELVEPAELGAVPVVFHGIWRPDPADPPVTPTLLRAMAKAGNYVTGAYDGDRLVGACVGFFGSPLSNELHSHVTGVAAAAAGRGVGFALKLHQRAWALGRGVSTITWTFDPLVRRNAFFNLVKLGATAAEYLPNFYGGMHDDINGGDDSDRLLVRWDLRAAEVTAACGGTPAASHAEAELARGAVVALARSDHDLPVAGSLDGRTVLVATPRDVERLRPADPDRARRWRTAVRDVLGTLMADGAKIAGFDRAGWYVVTRG
ncbi:MAG TPA: GNAT family N-acetyltransferase [Actinophytocola sp.]|uniref:GNAT family N-acetyltransferase n=1 Tax=Actinophytocola sp. TaxID=1872138 RepID=UPI002DDCB6E6|nr:GNAT family N-acetyltransferase [Actinophytocola sp.]HEV2782746.1 GNAT family N-acetyltransferase [Actinophytocola sp.]